MKDGYIRISRAQLAHTLKIARRDLTIARRRGLDNDDKYADMYFGEKAALEKILANLRLDLRFARGKLRATRATTGET